jgi:hypothetical protein
MASNLRSMSKEEFELGHVFERMVEGMRNEMNTVLWKIERSRDVAPEALKGMMRKGLEAMVGSVEKIMNGISDGMAKERRVREREEKGREERIQWLEEMEERGRRERKVRESKQEERRREEGKRMERLEKEAAENDKRNEEKLKSLEEKVEEGRKEREQGILRLERKLEKEKKENETREIRQEERAKKMEEGKERGGMEKEMEERVRRLEVESEKERKQREQDIRKIMDSVRSVEIATAVEREERVKMEEARRQEKLKEEVMEAEEEMGRKVEGAMEQMKILNIDFGRACENTRELAKEAVDRIQGKVRLEDRKEWEYIMKKTKVYILGKGTKSTEREGGRIFTVPVLLCCCGKEERHRLEEIIRKAGMSVSFQWPKEMLEFVKGVRHEVERMGYRSERHFVRVRPVRKAEEIVVKVDVRKKEGGQFKAIGYWKVPPVKQDMWVFIRNIFKPSWEGKGWGRMSDGLL